jgi:hypothetical protein
MNKKAATTEEKRNPFNTVVQNLKFHNFDEEPELTALYKNTVTIGEDEDPTKTFIANIMADVQTGEEKYVGNSYSIEKAIKTAKAQYKELMADVVFHIEFLGKTTVKGKPFNQFKIGCCLIDEYQEYAG